ncbi:hypothetical protein KXV50_009388 [Aspergillus fumigatus]|nr:hypothetical protein KXX14_002528 [Aspergillus fumigatus]KAH1743871.1 hypothetical protein KXX09_009282 [Aspergillus fumigatus]KAH1839723.1 hypothetical protein KXX54_002941 [Aspergillus fumigatus]KAH2284777.1 hypothetical protein KXV50_009388 [Aspergillus fumigatus]KAH2930933.1 hypothetical protein KXW15_008457 [Aspergillus fumigatus]
MRFLEFHTSIPVPHILRYGMAEESPDELGPFIIMEYIDHKYDLVDALNTPGIPDDERPMLDPQIAEERLIFAYGQMAGIMLQLSKHTFAEIGCIARANEDDDFDDVSSKWEIFLPTSFLMVLFRPSSYYRALADMHLAHLVTQRNDAVASPEDCRANCIARFLFRKLAREGRFCKYHERGPFKLFCDDFRPANVLTNAEFQVVGAVDWEYTYAAPLEFAYSAPFWLLLDLPEYWPGGLDDWTNVYETRLGTLLRVLEEREKVAIDRGLLSEEHRLSTYMREAGRVEISGLTTQPGVVGLST